MSRLCLRCSMHTAELLADLEIVEVAIWFHNAIYDSSHNDNKTESTEFAADRLHALSSQDASTTSTLVIEATAIH